MFVGWYMKTKLITVNPETTLFKARELLDANNISHLPVTDGKANLLGLITDRDIKEAWASPATTLSVHELTYVLQKLTVASVMTRDVVTATPDMHIERAAMIIHDNRIGALPVVKEGKLVGIITTTNLMEVLLTAVGLGIDSERLALITTDRIGILAEVGKLMHQADINIRSILTIPIPGYKDQWQIMMRISAGLFQQAVDMLRGAGYKVLVEYVEDLEPYLDRS
ncbi:MAG: CBS and ACT domain-containing protein [Syntrophobacteraceae bacterium]